MVLTEVDVSHILSDMLEPKNPRRERSEGEPARPSYGCSLVYRNGSFEGSLTFLAGEFYCCEHAGCHFHIQGEAFWRSLRKELLLNHQVVPRHLILSLQTNVEAGANFFDLKKPIRGRQGWYEYKTMGATSFRDRWRDGVWVDES